MSKEKINHTLGTQIADLVQILAVRKKWSKAYATQHIADAAGFGTDIVYKWRQNRITPSDDTLATLLRIGCKEAGLQRDWGVAVVQAAHFHEGMALVDELWEPEDREDVPHNLPKPTYSAFVGRQAELERLCTLLQAESNSPVIMINGIGGVGKTALVLHMAYRCLEASANPFTGSFSGHQCPAFSVIVFVSAKQKFLTADGILPRAYAPTTMRAILREIAYVFGVDIGSMAPDELPTHLRHLLGRQRTLLIVDNLETVEDKERVLAFLLDLPKNVKVVITTREQRAYTPIELGCLSHEEGLDLIKHEASYQQLQLSTSDAELLQRSAGGIPAAIIYGVGQLAAGRTINNVRQRLADHEGDIARFFFQDSVAPLRGRPAHRLLMATAIFEQSPPCQFVYQVAGLEEESNAANDACVQLLRLSLLARDGERFTLHPLTHEYTLAELTTHVEFELEARKRWLTLYRHFAATHGGPAQGDWYTRYAPVAEEWNNIYALLQWCIQQRRYDDLRYFWQQLREYISNDLPMTDRGPILDWLSQESERRGDWETYADILSQKALAMIMRENGENLALAGQLLQHAWSLRVDLSPLLQSYLADHLAAWYIFHQHFADALHWLQISTAVLTQIEMEMEIDEPALQRKKAYTAYWRAMHTWYSGATDAEAHFHEANALSEQAGWLRLATGSQKWLAVLALQRNDLAKAEQLLTGCLVTFATNHEQQQSAICRYLMALLLERKGLIVRATRLRDEAERLFEQMGLEHYPEELHKLQQQRP